MSFLSTRMGLRVWDLSADPYDHTQLANNWNAVDIHDHTNGKGIQIPSGGILDTAISTAKIQDSAVTGPKIADLSVTGSKLPDGVITNAKIANNAVTSDKIIDGAVTTAKFNDLSVTTSKLADSSVTGPKIANNSVDSNKLVNGCVGTTQLANSGVTTAKIADDAIDQNKIASGAVGTSEVSSGAITRGKLDPAIEPVGIVISWYRPNINTPLPTGWIPCDGRSLPFGDHDFVGGGIIFLPDLRNKFVLGADTVAGTGSGAGTSPSMGLIGGSHTRNVLHDHTIGGHTHAADNHAHGITPEGSHAHSFQGGKLLHSRRNAPITKTGAGGALTFVDTSSNIRSFDLQSVYLAGFNADPVGEYDDAFSMDNTGTHSHSGATAGSGAVPTSSAGAATTSSVFGTADDFRPAYVGLLFLIKVKAS